MFPQSFNPRKALRSFTGRGQQSLFIMLLPTGDNIIADIGTLGAFRKTMGLFLLSAMNVFKQYVDIPDADHVRLVEDILLTLYKDKEKFKERGPEDKAKECAGVVIERVTAYVIELHGEEYLEEKVLGPMHEKMKSL